MDSGREREAGTNWGTRFDIDALPSVPCGWWKAVLLHRELSWVLHDDQEKWDDGSLEGGSRWVGNIDTYS